MACAQNDLELLEASEDMDEEFYAGGGQYRRRGLEHFPQLWCGNGSYSLYGQVRPRCRHQQKVPFELVASAGRANTEAGAWSTPLPLWCGSGCYFLLGPARPLCWAPAGRAL